MIEEQLCLSVPLVEGHGKEIQAMAALQSVMENFEIRNDLKAESILRIAEWFHDKYLEVYRNMGENDD